MLVWDPETRGDAVRRAELSMLSSAHAVVYWRGRGQLTVEQLDALELDALAHNRAVAELVNPTRPTSVDELGRPSASVHHDEQANSSTSSPAGLTTRATGR